MLGIVFALAQAAAPAPATPTARLMVTGPHSAITTKDYPNLAECEAARDRVTSYNKRRMEEELKRKKYDDQDHFRVWVVCLPL